MTILSLHGIIKVINMVKHLKRSGGGLVSEKFSVLYRSKNRKKQFLPEFLRYAIN